MRICHTALDLGAALGLEVNRTLALLLAISVSLAGVTVAQSEGTIDVSGNAEIYAIPDEVLVSASIDSRGKTVVEASGENDKLVQAVKDFLKKSGIEDRHVRTEYLSLRPEYPQAGQKYGYQSSNLPAIPSMNEQTASSEPDPLKPVGYTAVRSFSIVIRDIAKFEGIYKGMLQLGVNRIDGVRFRTSELRKYRDEARTQAVKAAKEKATAMAKELGVELSGVKLVVEQNNQMDPFTTNSMQVAIPVGGESSSAGGEIAITATVRVVFFISPPQADMAR